ncbi:AsmA family protein [Gammaproteobacteria bacterium]|nr:AsmA family protein [Gammaproteobacteria bacterium]
MRKILKWLIAFFGISILFIVILAISLITFVNPNKLKPLLASTITDFSGYKTVINGDLSWNYFPSFGVRAKNIHLKNPPAFGKGNFIEIKDARINIDLLSVLNKKILSNKVNVYEMNLNLIKKNDKANWEFKKNPNALKNTKNIKNSKFVYIDILMESLSVKDSSITYKDVSTNDYFYLKNVNLRAKNINLLNPLLMSLQLDEKVTPSLDLDFEAELYQGNGKFDLKIDYAKGLPSFVLNAKLDNFVIAELMSRMYPKQKLTFKGRGFIDLKIASSGIDKIDLLKNLNGKGSFSVKEGLLDNIDINYYINSFISTISKNKHIALINNHKTNFSAFDASFVIENGVVISDNLTIKAKDFVVKGFGNLYLLNQIIKYKLQVFLNPDVERELAKNLYGLPVPLLIYGDLNNPSIGLDTELLAKSYADYQLEKAKIKLKKKLKKNKTSGEAGKIIKNLLGN